MKKIFYILASAIVALGAIACENEGLENVAPEVNGTETLSFTATIDNTKTALDGLKTIWVKGDIVMIDTYEFVCQEDLATFTCTGLTEEQVATLKAAEELTATYSKNKDGKVDSAAGVAGAVLQAEGNFNTGFNFKVKSAFLKFTTTEAVTLAGEGLFNNLAANYTGTDVYVAVNADVIANLSYSVNGFECKSAEIETTAGKIYKLGTLEAKAVMALVPGEFWKSAGARFAAYFFKDETNNTWVDMTEQNGKYVVETPAGDWANVIFCRMNPAETENKWGNAWNQTADLEIKKCQYYHVIGWTDQVAWTTSATRPTVTKETSGKYVFLKPNSNWKTDSARFAVYSYDSNGNEWDNMNKLTDDLYWINVSDIKAKVGSNNLIFCRMNPSEATNDWSNRWNQAPGSGGYQITSGKNCFTVSGWDGGSWSNYTAF